VAVTATVFPTTVAAATGSAWTNTANATGPTTGTVATFTTATGGAVGTLQLSAYDAQTAIGAQPGSIDSISLDAKQYVGTVARWSAASVQLYSGTTPIGTAQALTLSAATGNVQTVTFTGANLPTWAQLADLQVRFSATKSGTTSSTFNVDTAGLTVTTTPVGGYPRFMPFFP